MLKKIAPPARLMLLLTASIFTAEFLLTMLFQYWPLSALQKDVVDSFILVVVLSPAFYFLLYRPLRGQVRARLLVERELRKRNRELDLFVENVAHSLRSSMNTIGGAAWYLDDKYEERLEREDKKLLSIVQQESQKVLAIIDDLVSISRLQEGEIPGEAVDVKEVVRDVLDKMDDEYHGGESDVSIGDLPSVFISRSHLTVLLDNLLRNAVRYGSQEGACIEVYGQRSDKGVRLYVRDHGAGIPEQERKRIFDVLYRGARTKHLPGSGVGLTLARKIARLYGGDVRVEETPGGGATFCLELKDLETDGQE